MSTHITSAASWEGMRDSSCKRIPIRSAAPTSRSSVGNACRSDLPWASRRSAPTWLSRSYHPAIDPARRSPDWLSAGTRLVWVIDPERRLARIYRQDGSESILGETDALEGEDILPGFACKLGAVLETIV